MCALLDALIADGDAGIRVAFAVIQLATGHAVGWTTYGFFSAVHERLEIGWTWYGRAAWRTAVNSESKLLLLTHAFEDLGMGRVSFRTDHLNTRRPVARREGAVDRPPCRWLNRIRPADHSPAVLIWAGVRASSG
nr:GNAT family N-acetyltransferase [Frankia sp. Cr1]